MSGSVLYLGAADPWIHLTSRLPAAAPPPDPPEAVMEAKLSPAVGGAAAATTLGLAPVDQRA
jgi:hypothetical protein